MSSSPLLAAQPLSVPPVEQPVAQRHRRQLSIGVLPVVGCFAAIFIAAVRPVTDNDVWWHLATGHYIVTHRLVPHADVFSWTAPGRAWIAHEWLTEVLLYSLWTHGGTAVLMLAFAAVITATFGVVYWSCRRQGVHPIIAMPLTLLAAAASSHTWGTRPQMLSLLLLAIYAALLQAGVPDSRNGKPWKVVVFPAGMILWVNLHGGFIFGLLLMGLVWFGDWLPAFGRTLAELLIRSAPQSAGQGSDPGFSTPPQPISLPTVWQRNDTRDNAGGDARDDMWKGVVLTRQRFPFVLLLASFLVTVINPNTWQALLYPFSYLGNNASMRYIAEWVSPDFHQGRYLFFEALLLILFLALALSPRRPRLGDVLLVVVFSYLGLESVRNISLFAVILAPLAATHAQLILSRWKEQVVSAIGSPQPASSRRQRRPIDRRREALHWLIVGCIVGAVAIIVQPLISPQTQARAVAKAYPVGAVAYLKRHAATLSPGRAAGRGAAEQGIRLFNSYNWGGYLIWTLSPTYRVFIDGRPDMYGDAFVDQYVQTSSAGPGWLAQLKHVDVVVLETNSPLATALAQTKGWQLVYHDSSAVIYQQWPT